MHSSIGLLAAIAVAATAKTIVINTGQGGLSFSPDSVTANKGDTLEFHFFGSIHTVVQSQFSAPCVGSGFESGPISNKADGSGSVFQVTVQNTDPIWFFCGAPSHCQAGMVGVVNPPSSGNTLATYRSNAAGTSSSQSSGKAQGGVVVPAGGSGSGPSSSSSSSASSTGATTSSKAPVSSSDAAPTSAEPSSTPSSSQATSSKSTSPQTTQSSTSKLISPTMTSSLKASSISGNATLSATASPTFVPASKGTSMMEMTEKCVLLSIVLGMTVAMALMS